MRKRAKQAVRMQWSVKQAALPPNTRLVAPTSKVWCLNPLIGAGAH